MERLKPTRVQRQERQPREQRITREERQPREPRSARQERQPRGEQEEPPKPGARDRRWPHGKLFPDAQRKIKGNLHYLYEVGSVCKEKRWYVVGRVFIAYVQVYDGDMKAGNYTVFINSQLGNSGKWFDEEEEVHDFIKGELEKDPMP